VCNGFATQEFSVIFPVYMTLLLVYNALYVTLQPFVMLSEYTFVTQMLQK